MGRVGGRRWKSGLEMMDSHHRKNFGKDDRGFGQVVVENPHLRLIRRILDQSGEDGQKECLGLNVHDHFGV
jgi:hypothetical protein